MKRGLLGFSLLVFLAQVVSAQFFSGYGGFSITNFFSSIDPATMTLGLSFFIFFALIFYALSKIFKDPYGQPNKGIAGTIAFAVSLLIIYGIYRSGFNLEDLFYGFGIGEGTFYLIAFIIFIVLAFFLIKKIKFRGFLIVFGLLFILLTIFTDIFYEKLTALIIGIVLLLVGILLLKKRKKKLAGYYGDYGPSPQEPRRLSRRREKRRELRDIKYGQKMDYKRQKAEQKMFRKQQQQERKRQEQGLGQRTEEGQRRQMEKQRRQQQQELTERQKQREKGRKAGLRQINQQVKVIDRQLRNPNISEHSKRVLRQRMEDLENRRKTLKKYGIGKGNI